MKRTLKRELKGLEVVKTEANGFSTDRGANQGVRVAARAALRRRARWSSPARHRCCALAGTLRRPMTVGQHGCEQDAVEGLCGFSVAPLRWRDAARSNARVSHRGRRGERKILPRCKRAPSRQRCPAAGWSRCGFLVSRTGDVG